jgi:hypothetical protein
MSLKRRASWYFSSTKYGYDYENSPYPEILSDLKIILSILIESKLLVPKIIDDDIALVYDDVDELISIINSCGRINDASLFDIKGDTIIYHENEETVFSNILSIRGYRTFQQFFSIEVSSDIFLPMVFDEKQYDFIWNLERYQLNYYRVPQMLKKLNEVLSWGNEELLIKEYHERGSLQIGYNFFINPEIISKQFKQKHNEIFNLDQYLKEIKDSI